MAFCTSPALVGSASWSSTLSLAGASSSNPQRTSLKLTYPLTLPSQISNRRAHVSAEYRRGGAGDFVAGFLLGGLVFGALGYVLAPQITKSLEGAKSEKEEDLGAKKSAQYLEDEESLETTRKNLNERIAQLSAAIDVVSAQVKTDGFNFSSGNNVELESPA